MQGLQSGLGKAVCYGTGKEHLERLLIYILYLKKKKRK